ncbi:helix-turn-helix transcriptional regulator [Bacillus sp. FSL W7-1360]
MSIKPDHLRSLRKQRKLTQEQLGQMLGVTKVSVSGYETGNRNPDTSTLIKICDTFNVSADYLLGRTVNATLPLADASLTDEENKLLREYLAFLRYK